MLCRIRLYPGPVLFMKMAGPQDLKKKYNATWALVTVSCSRTSDAVDKTGSDWMINCHCVHNRVEAVVLDGRLWIALRSRVST